MNIDDFKNIFDEYYEEVNKSGHDIDKKVEFYLDDFDKELKIDSIEINRLVGCGCESGIIFHLKHKED